MVIIPDPIVHSCSFPLLINQFTGISNVVWTLVFFVLNFVLANLAFKMLYKIVLCNSSLHRTITYTSDQIAIVLLFIKLIVF